MTLLGDSGALLNVLYVVNVELLGLPTAQHVNRAAMRGDERRTDSDDTLALNTPPVLQDDGAWPTL